MSDTFTPFVTVPVSTGETAMFLLKVLPQAEAKAVFEPLPDGAKPEPPAKACSPPSVTLQRQGETVSGIRIECGCGQVIELACVF
jgi:hypothetical protein